MRKITSDKIFDTLVDIQDGVNVSLCYVSGVSVKKTKRAIDSDKFGQDLEQVEDKNKSWYGKLKDFQEQEKGKLPFKGVVRFSLYSLGYTTEETYRKGYGEYKNKENELRQKYGLDPIKDREEKHDELNSYGVSTGATENTRNRAYIHLNTSDSDKKSMCFGVNFDDTITEEIPYSVLREVLTKKSGDSGVSQLRKLERSEEEIEQYISELEGIKKGYEFRKFDLSKLLYIIINKDDEQMYWVNDSLTNKLSKDLELEDTSDIFRVSKEVFKETRSLIKENMKRENKRLNEFFDHNDYSDLYKRETEVEVNPECEEECGGERWIVWAWPMQGYVKHSYLCYANEYVDALERVGNYFVEEGLKDYYYTLEDIKTWFEEEVEDGVYEEGEFDEYLESLTDYLQIDNDKLGSIWFPNETQAEKVKFINESKVKVNKSNLKTLVESVVNRVFESASDSEVVCNPEDSEDGLSSFLFTTGEGNFLVYGGTFRDALEIYARHIVDNGRFTLYTSQSEVDEMFYEEVEGGSYKEEDKDWYEETVFKYIVPVGDEYIFFYEDDFECKRVK